MFELELFCFLVLVGNSSETSHEVENHHPSQSFFRNLRSKLDHGRNWMTKKNRISSK